MVFDSYRTSHIIKKPPVYLIQRAFPYYVKRLAYNLLHRHRFRQISWLIHITSAHYSNMVSQEL
jgi:hypothetical protein